jgi:predicted RND superfamily exporter protein
MQLEHINRRFRQLGELTVRLRWAVIVSFVITSGIALWGMTLITFDTSNDNWFFEGDALKIATDEFNEIFGNSAYPAILVEAEDVFAPNILRMIRELGEEMLDRVPFADEVYSLTEAELITGTEEGLLIEPIVPDEIPATPAKVEEIRQRAFSKEFWYNRLFTPDSRMTWIILRLHSYPDDWRQ